MDSCEILTLLCFSCIFLCFSYSYVWQTKLASSLVNFNVNVVFNLIKHQHFYYG